SLRRPTAPPPDCKAPPASSPPGTQRPGLPGRSEVSLYRLSDPRYHRLEHLPAVLRRRPSRILARLAKECIGRIPADDLRPTGTRWRASRPRLIAAAGSQSRHVYQVREQVQPERRLFPCGVVAAREGALARDVDISPPQEQSAGKLRADRRQAVVQEPLQWIVPGQQNDATEAKTEELAHGRRRDVAECRRLMIGRPGERLVAALRAPPP